MRQAIAAAMTRSKREIPHYYLSTTIDMDSAMKWLVEENLKRPVADRLLYGVLLIKAVALALRKVPELNAIWKGDHHEVSNDIHIGVAISLRTGGLIAPALHHTDRQSLSELMKNFSDLVQRARTGGLRSSELSDPTITITSLGEQGVETVFPIIYPPQTAMVGFGRIAERPWVVQGQIVSRPCLRQHFRQTIVSPMDTAAPVFYWRLTNCSKSRRNYDRRGSETDCAFYVTENRS